MRADYLTFQLDKQLVRSSVTGNVTSYGYFRLIYIQLSSFIHLHK